LRGVLITQVKFNVNDQFKSEAIVVYGGVLLAEVSTKGGSTLYDLLPPEKEEKKSL
jgi:hypothetical protein